MNLNHLTEEQLVLHHYGDAGDEAEAASVAGHLRECPACQAELDGLLRALSAANQLAVPDPGESYGARVFARIQPSLAQGRPGWRDRLASPKSGWILAGRRWAWAGGAAALVVAAFVAGDRVAHRQPAPAAVPQAAQRRGTEAQAGTTPTGAEERGSTAPAAPASAVAAADRERVRAGVLLVAVSGHLERSEVALSELVNSPRGPEVDISEERGRARDLVAENRLYRQTALAAGEPAVAGLLDDLERALVEVANGPSRMNEAEFDRVRRRIVQQDILFKIRVFGERVREAEGRPAAGSGLRG